MKDSAFRNHDSTDLILLNGQNGLPISLIFRMLLATNDINKTEENEQSISAQSVGFRPPAETANHVA